MRPVENIFLGPRDEGRVMVTYHEHNLSLDGVKIHTMQQ